MKHPRSLAVILLLTSPVFAADLTPPSCVEEKITVQKLTQDNSKLTRQLMLLDAQFGASLQPQFRTLQQTGEAAKAEQARLEALLPKKADENPKKESAEQPAPEKK